MFEQGVPRPCCAAPQICPSLASRFPEYGRHALNAVVMLSHHPCMLTNLKTLVVRGSERTHSMIILMLARGCVQPQLLTHVLQQLIA